MKGSITNLTLRSATGLVVVMLMLGAANTVNAQFTFRWLNIGEMATPYSEAGAVREEEPFGNAELQWPAIEMEAGNTRAAGLWIATTNYTDEEGRIFPHKVAHVGPRSGGDVQFFPEDIRVISRFEPPVITVDGDNSFRRYVYVDSVDATLPADRIIRVVNTNRIGIRMEAVAYAWSQEYHDDYHILEYRFTNTGNVDLDPEIELDQTLTGVYFFFINRYDINASSSWARGDGAPWGKFTMNDAVGDGHEDYSVDFTAQYAWAGINPFETSYSTLGGPLFSNTQGHGGGFGWMYAEDDTLGRLAAGHMAGRVYLHADKSVDDEDNAIDPTYAGTTPADPAVLAGRQPATMGVFGSDEPDLVDQEYDKDLMTRQYQDWILGTKYWGGGRMYPHHADRIEPEGNFDTPTGSPHILWVEDEGGYAFIEGFGPYTMKPGDDVRLVIAHGVQGLDPDAKMGIGAAYKAAGFDDALEIEWPPESGDERTKNQWVMSTKDSLFQMFERAIANYESDYDIPEEPYPPKDLTLSSLPDKIALTWDVYGTGPAITGFEIYRVDKRFTDINSYELIATLPGAARSYDDTTPDRGVEYFYYIQAVGEVNTDATGNTPIGVALRSGRYYAQTYIPAILKREAGIALEEIRIVPNPFHLGANQDIRWPDRQDKLGFMNIPGICTISIYTQLGELVTKIEHTDGSGDEYWDHTTDSRQVIASGLYIAVIEDTEKGGKIFKKFVIIR